MCSAELLNNHSINHLPEEQKGETSLPTHLYQIMNDTNN